jgi:hypothetical protein
MPTPPKLGIVKPFPKSPEKAWSAVECLEEFLADVKAGKVTPDKVMIFYTEPLPDGNQMPHYWVQNVSVTERIAYGALIQRIGIEEWRNE